MTGDPPTPPSTGRNPAVNRPAWAALRVGILGLNAWVVAVLVPTLHVGVGGLWETLLAAIPLLGLAVGLAVLDTRREMARWTLLAVVGPAMAVALASRPELVERETFDPAAALLAAVSVVAYLGAAAHAVSRPTARRKATVHPLRAKEPVAEPGARRWLRRALLGVSALGALAIAVLAPAWSTRSERADAWAAAGDDSLVLTTVVGAIVAALALGAIVGPSLRADRRTVRSAKRERRRVLMSLAVAAIAGLGWLVLVQLDAG